MKRSTPLFAGCALAVVALDQWTKFWATHHLAFSDPVRVVGELVQLTYTRNSGIAFGLFAGLGFPLYVFSIVAAVVVLALFSRHPVMSLARQLSLALILGGALGNLVDRVATGEVVDFILLSWRGHEFPVFNVADIAVTCGMGLFLIAWTRESEPSTEGPMEAVAHAADGGAERAGAGSGPAGGPLAGEGPDRPLP